MAARGPNARVFHAMADNYAIIRLGNKQHRVRDGETLVVDRLSTEAGKSFEPDVLLGEGKVTATVVAHERGPKIRIGKYRRRTGYKRHNGYRSATTRVQISLGAAKRATAAKKQADPAPPAEGAPEGYEEMTIAQIKEAAAGWTHAQVEAALAYERGAAARKGAISALEAALKED
jgi:large subunit ribosomal protein L21